MSKNGDTGTRWTPRTPQERELVLVELHSILSSYHFRSSKRYPALLEYVVSKTLDGQSENLKERTLGVEVFDRQPDYDTNADPVVRFSAGEIRKRIAQYYHETGEDSRLQIDLPLGSYIPEFKPRLVPSEPGADAIEPEESLNGNRVRSNQVPVDGLATSAAAEKHNEPTFVHGARRKLYLRWAVSFLVLAVISGVTYSLRKVAVPTVADEMWGPLLQPPGPILIVIGSGHPELITPEPSETSLMEHMTGPYHHISLSSALALSRLSGVLQGRGKTYEIKEGSVTSLTDLRSRSVILVGALNNLWTLRLLEPLRFHFDTHQVAHIEDTKNAQNLNWSVDFQKPFASVSSDYAIVARYHDATTDGTVLVVAGIGPYGTEAASEFVASPRYLEQLLRKLPSGWENRNLEIVLKTDVIAGEAGPPYLIASTIW